MFVFHDPKYYNTSDWLGPGQKKPYRKSSVFRKHHTGRPLCLDPMIRNIILPQIGLAQDQIKNHAIREGHCILETPYKGPTVFGSHDRGTWIGGPWRRGTRFGIMLVTHWPKTNIGSLQTNCLRKLK